ncbi:UBA2 [Symbiodinium sp. CCMP2592]|nr:UBA2 [Symbiodinium sp. CCMP2592]
MHRFMSPFRRKQPAAGAAPSSATDVGSLETLEAEAREAEAAEKRAAEEAKEAKDAARRLEDAVSLAEERLRATGPASAARGEELKGELRDMEAEAEALRAQDKTSALRLSALRQAMPAEDLPRLRGQEEAVRAETQEAANLLAELRAQESATSLRVAALRTSVDELRACQESAASEASQLEAALCAEVEVLSDGDEVEELSLSEAEGDPSMNASALQEAWQLEDELREAKEELRRLRLRCDHGLVERKPMQAYWTSPAATRPPEMHGPMQEPFNLNPPSMAEKRHDSLLQAAQSLVSSTHAPDCTALSERLVAENRRLESEMHELQEFLEAQPLNSGGNWDSRQPLAGAVHESHSKLRSSMQQQLQSSQDALQHLRQGIAEAEARLQAERRKRPRNHIGSIQKQAKVMLELFKLLLGKGTEGFRTRQVSRDEDKIIGFAWSGCSAVTGSLVGLAVNTYTSFEAQEPKTFASGVEKKVPRAEDLPPDAFDSAGKIKAEYVVEEAYASYPEKHSVWDKIVVPTGTMTLEAFKAWLASEHKLQLRTWSFVLGWKKVVDEENKEMRVPVSCQIYPPPVSVDVSLLPPLTDAQGDAMKKIMGSAQIPQAQKMKCPFRRCQSLEGCEVGKEIDFTNVDTDVDASF